MFFRKIFGLFLIALLFFGLFGFFRGGRGFDAADAYRQGFIDGQQAAGSAEGAEGAAVVPNSSGGTNIYYRDRGFFFPGSAFLLCLVPLFAFGFMAMMAGKHKRHGRYGGWGAYDPCGPRRRAWKHGTWNGWDDAPKEKSPDDIDDGPPEPAMQA